MKRVTEQALERQPLVGSGQSSTRKKETALIQFAGKWIESIFMVALSALALGIIGAVLSRDANAAERDGPHAAEAVHATTRSAIGGPQCLTASFAVREHATHHAIQKGGA